MAHQSKSDTAAACEKVVEVAGVKHTLEDEYQWLRGKAWPKLVEDEDIIAHLEAENAYCKDFLASLGGLQEAFFQTMKGRMKLTDRTIEVRHGGYYYYSRTEEELQYSIDCRVPLAAFDALKKSGPVPDAALRGAEEVILDRNKLAEGKAFCKALGTTVSLNGKVMAYRVDTQGDENYCLQFVSLESGEPPARPAVGPSRARSLLTQLTDRQASTCPTSCGTSRATASTSLPTRRRRARHPSASSTPCATGTSAQQRSSTTGLETRPKGAKTSLQTTVCCSSRRMRCSVCRSAQPPTRSSSRCGTAARRRMRCLRSTWPTAICGWSAVLPSAARGVDGVSSRLSA